MSQICPGFDDLRLRLVQFGRVGTRIDDAEQVAFFNDLPFDEMNRLQVPANPRADLDKIDRIEAADVLVPLDY